MDLSTRGKKRRFAAMDNNLVGTIHTETSGKGCKRFSDIQDNLLERYCSQQGAGEILDIIVTMENYLRRDTCTIHTLFEKFKILFECVTCFERRVVEDVMHFDREDANALLFYKLGGMEAAKRIIMLEGLLPTDSRYREESAEQLRMKAVLFEAIARMISSDSIGETMAKELAEDEDLLIHLFQYVKHDQTYSTVCTLLEDILQNRPVLILSNIPNLEKIILGLKDKKLMNFCRIIAVTISDLDVYENKVSLFAQNKQRKSEKFVNVRDLNQEFLLNIPNLIEQLVEIAVSTKYSPRYRGLTGEIENWMQWIDNTNSDDLFDVPEIDDDADEFIGGVTQPREPAAPWGNQPSIDIINNIIYKVECVHVLVLLLVGKHRHLARKLFADLKLIPGISCVFDNFMWKLQGSRTGANQRLVGHNASCECSPEVALKIQIMRLIHTFANHSQYQHLLVTRSELGEIQRINDKAGILAIEGLDNINRANMCKGKEGLISRMVEVMKKEPTSTTLRFWLNRACETFLTGPTAYCDQVFLLRRGVLQHLVNSLSDGEIKPNEIVQSSFDLLAELVKFNIESFKIIEDILRTQEVRSRFVDLVNKNLVNSNMFIRGAILSYGFFCSKQTEHTEYAKRVNYLLSYMGSFQQIVNYLHQMIGLTNVHAVSQENVSCLNTALVMIMTMSKSDSVVPYLQALKDEKITYTTERQGGSIIISNFRELLIFWKEHYLHSDKNVTSLETSTRIKISEWSQTVDSLICKETTNPTSLSHYLEDDSAERA